MSESLLSVNGLGVSVHDGSVSRALITDIGFDLARGASLGIVGSSGAGKSTLGLALLGMLPHRGRFTDSSSIRLIGAELAGGGESAWRAIRGRRIGIVFQEPLLALDPVMPIGDQLAEAVVAHGMATGPEAKERAEAALGRVGIPQPRLAMKRYAHEFSGGMRQRALIASAIVLEPDVIVADEPTTALDPTLQAQVLNLLDSLRAATGTALLLISHDLDVIGERCERALVLDAGRIVELGTATTIVRSPTSVAGRRLAAARRRASTPRVSAASVAANGAATTPPLLVIDNVSVRHEPRRGIIGRLGTAVHAVTDVTLQIDRGEALGLIGESGCGKTSLAHAILRLGTVSEGAVRFEGQALSALRPEAMRRVRRRLQFISQDAGASLTPHLTVEQLIGEGIEVHNIAQGADVQRRVRALLDELGLPHRAATAFPGELSTGERQRVAIARALAVEPELLICDEPVASVDADTRIGLLDRLDVLRREHGLALLLISHDLDAVRRITSRIAVMYLGRIVELADSSVVAAAPRMPYTQTLLAAEPTGDPAERSRRSSLRGDVPSPADVSIGCPFQPRCLHPLKDAQCTAERPPLRELAPGHFVACWKA